MRWSLVVMASTSALVAVGVIALTWEERADDICREQAPRAASDYSITWQWDEFAYVCDYRVPSEKPKSIGIIDAFHGEGSRRHRPR